MCDHLRVKLCFFFLRLGCTCLSFTWSWSTLKGLQWCPPKEGAWLHPSLDRWGNRGPGCPSCKQRSDANQPCFPVSQQLPPSLPSRPYGSWSRWLLAALTGSAPGHSGVLQRLPPKGTKGRAHLLRVRAPPGSERLQPLAGREGLQGSLPPQQVRDPATHTVMPASLLLVSQGTHSMACHPAQGTGQGWGWGGVGGVLRLLALLQRRGAKYTLKTLAKGGENRTSWGISAVTSAFRVFVLSTEYLLSTYCMLDTVPGAGNRAGSMTDRAEGHAVQWERPTVNRACAGPQCTHLFYP